MRVVESWVAAPLQAFLDESGARLTLLMTSAGQVVAQDGFTRSVDVMAAAALGAAINASTDALSEVMGAARFGSVLHQGSKQHLFLRAFDTPRGRWIGLVVYGGEASSAGLVQLFFQHLADALAQAAPVTADRSPVLAEDFEHELNASLRSLFGR